MDYLYIVNAFKQQQQQFLLHQQQLQQQLLNHPTASPLSIQQQIGNSNMSDTLIWQPWKDLHQDTAAHHNFYYQQQKLHLQQETRLPSKELPTTTWRRERRLRTGEYHHHIHHQHVGQSSLIISARDSSPSSPPPPNAHTQYSPSSSSHSSSVSNTNAQLNSNVHQISIMMAAAAAASMRPLCESTNRSTPPLPPQNPLTGQDLHLGEIAHTQVLQHLNSSHNDDVPLDMSVGSFKQRNSPPPPYREPLPGSQYSSSLPRPSVITQAPPKRDPRDSALVLSRENDNRSCESIDEHFRRSLGNDYFALFSKSSPASHSTKTPPPQPQAAHVRTPPPSLISSGISSLSMHSVLVQSELNPPPAYPLNLPPSHHQTNSQQAHQTPSIITPKANNNHLTTAGITTQIKSTRTSSSSPPLPLVVKSVVQPQHQPPLILQKNLSITASTPLTTSPQSPASTKNFKLCNSVQIAALNTPHSKTTSPHFNKRQQQSSTATQPQQESFVATNFSIIENSPSSSPSDTHPTVSVSNTSQNLPTIVRIKTEPGLQNVKSHNPTPPASPTSTTNPNITSTSYSPNTPSLSSPITSAWKPINATNTSTEVLASVDDHFAKALGDTWKKLQESKEIRK